MAENRLCYGLTNDREVLKRELIKLLDDLPLERLKALYIKALVSVSHNG